MERLDVRLKKIENNLQLDNEKEVTLGDIDRKEQMARLEGPREGNSFSTYADSFMSLINQVELSEANQVALFVEGLKGDKKLIKILNPNTLQRAIDFARVLTQEEDTYTNSEGAKGQMSEEVIDLPIKQHEFSEGVGLTHALSVLHSELTVVVVRPSDGTAIRVGSEVESTVDVCNQKISFLDYVDILGQATLRTGRIDKGIEFLNPNGEFRWDILKGYYEKMNLERGIVWAMQGKGFEALYGYSPTRHIPYSQGITMDSEEKQGFGDREVMLQLLPFHLLRVQHEVVQLAYGSYKTDLRENNPLNVTIIDFGHFSRQVSIAVLEKGQLKTLSNSYDQNLGGRAFDKVLFMHLATWVKEQFKIVGYQNVRACSRLGVVCERLEFQDGNLVVFSEVQGMSELNTNKSRRIKNARPYSFILEEDTSRYKTYERGGIVTQVKLLNLLKFNPLKEALKDPNDFLLSNSSRFDQPPLLHLAFEALHKFLSDFERYPVAGSEDDAQWLTSIAGAMNDNADDVKPEDIDPKLLQHFAFGSKAILNPMAAMFGGIVGQEVVKACSGKFYILFQFFYFDSLKSLPTKAEDADDVRPLKSRYDAQISVFGSKLQRKLEDAKVFLVGSGALVCEFLKYLTLTVVFCGHQNKLTVTDNDAIEKSNLSRQFLFRDWNIGHAKSTVAAWAATLCPNRGSTKKMPECILDIKMVQRQGYDSTAVTWELSREGY